MGIYNMAFNYRKTDFNQSFENSHGRVNNTYVDDINRADLGTEIMHKRNDSNVLLNFAF